MDLFDVDIDSALAINELSILQILERRHVILLQKNVEAEQLAERQECQRVHREHRNEADKLDLIKFDFGFVFQFLFEAFLFSDALLFQDCDETFDLDYYHREKRNEGRKEQSEEQLVIILANTVIEPNTVVIESVDALVALSAMLAVLFDVELANLTVKLVVAIHILESPIFPLEFQLDSNYWIFGVDFGCADAVRYHKQDRNQADCAH